MTNMGNIMKFFESQYIDELSDDDDDDYYEFEDDIPEQNLTEVFPNKVHLTTDAAPRRPESLPQPESKLNLDRINEIESELDEDEIVSLVYLLFEDNYYALQELRLRLEDSSRRLLQEWARREENARNSWAKKMIEALCIIQNYKILRKLGYDKQQAIDHYLPHHPNTTLYVNKMRKICYILCEKMNNEKTQRFVNLLKKDLIKNGQDISNLVYDYLEMYFLELEINKYVNRMNLTNIKKILKVMDDDDLYNVIEENMVVRNVDAHNTELNLQHIKVLERDNKPSLSRDIESFRSGGSFDEIPSGTSSMQSSMMNPRKTSTSMDNNRVMTRQDFTLEQAGISPSIKSQSPGIEKYPIDPNHPGVVLIINQQEFFTEFEPKYKHLLPKDTTNKLEPRTGTEKDRDDLINTFERFGFEVIVKENLIHIEMETEIKDVLSKITNQSSLFICILSHGDKGIVYGSNSCRVKVSKIQKLMCKTNKANLQGKPKILILQSCQGQQCQKINASNSDENDSSDSDSCDLTTDSASRRQPVPKTADMLTFWATVPGYAAVRHKKSGSWFIQAICKQMLDLGNQIHFADICTCVMNEVTHKKWSTPDGDNVTTPMVVNTLTKSFYLPSVTS